MIVAANCRLALLQDSCKEAKDFVDKNSETQTAVFKDELEAAITAVAQAANKHDMSDLRQKLNEICDAQQAAPHSAERSTDESATTSPNLTGLQPPNKMVCGRT